MKAATAIRKYIGDATMKEIKAFKDTCGSDEWQEYGRQACELLGEKYEAPKTT